MQESSARQDQKANLCQWLCPGLCLDMVYTGPSNYLGFLGIKYSKLTFDFFPSPWHSRLLFFTTLMSSGLMVMNTSFSPLQKNMISSRLDNSSPQVLQSMLVLCWDLTLHRTQYQLLLTPRANRPDTNSANSASWWFRLNKYVQKCYHGCKQHKITEKGVRTGTFWDHFILK